MKSLIHYPSAALALVGLLLAGPLAAQSGDVERGRGIATGTCIACHGEDGNGLVPNFPKLAGQHADYLLKQLQEFAGSRRENEIMKPIVDAMSAQDMADVSVYYATQRTSPGQVADATLLEQGRRVYDDGDPEAGVPACAGCHGPRGIGNPRYPRLAGQYTVYTIDQMQRFADGRRTNDKRLMQTVAARLGEADTRAVAEYIASLEPTP